MGPRAGHGDQDSWAGHGGEARWHSCPEVLSSEKGASLKAGSEEESLCMWENLSTPVDNSCWNKELQG